MTATTRLFDGTKQGLFDTIVTHLFTQGRPALVDEAYIDSLGDKAFDVSLEPGNCAYRGPNGIRCAVGCVIPDDKYTMEMENLVASDPIVYEAVGIKGEDFITVSLMRALQHEHDTVVNRLPDGRFDRAKLIISLREVASRFALNTDAIPAA